MRPTCPTPRCRHRARRVLVPGLMLVLGLAAVASCSADEARESVIAELAVGSWACAPDAEGSAELPFTVRIAGDGTFAVAVEPAALDEDRGLPDELTGTWAIEDGDLRWGFDRYGGDQAVVEGFDALTLESSEFTLQFPGIFEANDGTDDPAEEQDFLVDANGTDSVTLRVRTGAPWTCDRQ